MKKLLAVSLLVLLLCGCETVPTVVTTAVPMTTAAPETTAVSVGESFAPAEYKIKEEPYYLKEVITREKDYHYGTDTYRFTEDGGMYIRKETLSRVTELSFNSKGELTERSYYAAGGDDLLEYERYENGELTERTYYYDESVKTDKWEYVYTYDEGGRVSQKKILFPDASESVYAYTYDANGALASQTLDGNKEIWEYTYYSDGTLKSEKHKLYFIGYTYELIEYTESGKLARYSALYDPAYEEEGIYEEITVYRYDEKDRLTYVAHQMFDPERGDHREIKFTQISYDDVRGHRNDLHYRVDNDGNEKLLCEFLLVYNVHGDIVSVRTLRGDEDEYNGYYMSEFTLDYIAGDPAEYDEYGRVVFVDGYRDAEYFYEDCTQEQAALYQKIAAQGY